MGLILTINTALNGVGVFYDQPTNQPLVLKIPFFNLEHHLRRSNFCWAVQISLRSKKIRTQDGWVGSDL